MNDEIETLPFSPIQTTRLYESIVEQIESLIDKGEFKPGDQLPTERDLASRLNVSRAVLTQAFRVLESNGVIEVRQGSGRYIRQWNPLENDYGILHNLERAAIRDLLEVREVLECRIVELACERATGEDLEEIQKTINYLGDYESDVAFHLAIAQASHNVVFVNMLRSNMNILYRTREETLMLNRKIEDIVSEHEAIYEAIANEDKSIAVVKIMDHIHGIQSKLES